MSTTDLEVVVVGTGPAGLATTLALATADPKIMRRSAIVDPSGAWLDRWNDRMARQGIRHLRSPNTHHPHPDPWLMVHHCTRERFPDVERDGRLLPSTAGFTHFVERVVDEHDLPDVVPAVVEDVALADGSADVELSDGSSVRCRRLVVATGSGSPFVPSGIPDDPRIRHADDVDLRTPPPAGTRVVVVGGGLSAAHLALGAVAAGLSVTLALRGAFRVRHFDVAPGWMGPKYLQGFRAQTDKAERRTAVARARGGGSVPPWARRALADLDQAGAIEVLRECPLRSVVAEPSSLRALLGTEERETDEVWLATGYDQSVAASPLLSRVASQRPIPIHDGIPDLDDDLAWGGSAVHVVGAPASLVLGPTAGNLHGQRRGAARVAKAAVPSYEPDGDLAYHLH